MTDKNFMSIDLELNQPSNTIIQVGVVVGNLNSGEILREFSSNILVSEEIAEEITQLTHITQKDVDEGNSLEKVYRYLRFLHKYYDCFRNPITWGGGDSECLRKELKLDEEDFVFGRRWIDAKTLFISRCLARGERTQSGLAKAMVRMGMKFEGRKHCAVDDARNTFYIYRALLGEIVC